MKGIMQALGTRDALDRCAAALERVAAALEQHLPPIQPEEVPKLQEADYKPASDHSTFIEQTYKIIEEAEGPFDAEKEQRVRAFIKSQYNL